MNTVFRSFAVRPISQIEFCVVLPNPASMRQSCRGRQRVRSYAASGGSGLDEQSLSVKNGLVVFPAGFYSVQYCDSSSKCEGLRGEISTLRLSLSLLVLSLRSRFVGSRHSHHVDRCAGCQ
jgi:hypothetical protein